MPLRYDIINMYAVTAKLPFNRETEKIMTERDFYVIIGFGHYR